MPLAPVCPAGHGPLVVLVAVQPALFVHGGYGEARRTTWRACPSCGWQVTAAVESVNPRHL